MYRDRLYSPEEVRRLLGRAAAIEETHAKERRAEAAPLTFEQLAALARDAGISEESLRRAATESAQPTKKRYPLSIAGAPAKIAVERAVRGYVGPTNHAQLVRAMRRALSDAGNSQVLGESLAWSTTMKTRQVHITLEPLANGKVSVRIDEDLRNLLGGLFGGFVGGIGGGGLGVIAPLIAPWVPASLVPLAITLWVLTVFLVTREVYVARYRAREAELQALLDELADHVHGAARPEAPRARVAPAANERERLERAAEEEAVAIEEASLTDRAGRAAGR